jgi:hypothetical protein
MLAMTNLNPGKLNVLSCSVSGNMDDIKVTAVLIGSIIPQTLACGKLMVLLLEDIVSPVYLCAVCSQATHCSCTLSAQYVICRLS